MNTPTQGGPLFAALLSRALPGQTSSVSQPAVMPAASGLPTTPPPNPTTKVPPATNRWATAESMKQAYANGWSPNPLILRALGGSH